MPLEAKLRRVAAPGDQKRRCSKMATILKKSGREYQDWHCNHTGPSTHGENLRSPLDRISALPRIRVGLYGEGRSSYRYIVGKETGANKRCEFSFDLPQAQRAESSDFLEIYIHQAASAPSLAAADLPSLIPRHTTGYVCMFAYGLLIG